MSKKEWVLVAVVIGGGILLQIPGHDGTLSHETLNHGAVEHEDDDHATESRDASVRAVLEVPENGPYRTVALEVTGMT